MKKTGPPLNTTQPVHVFAIGERVRLKTGGPLMLVKEIFPDTTDQKVLCAWFEGTKLEGELFPSELLQVMK